jgi:ribosomal protein S18 acetylase RimI-like enzyme
MEIVKVNDNKKQYISLLLLGDEQENMIDKYIERGEMYVLNDNGPKTVCVVTKESDDTYEIKNIATDENSQGHGYGHKMIQYIVKEYKNKCNKILVGTGNNEKILSFYRNNGFIESHIVKDFFVNNYDHKIYEDGKQLIDMIYLKMEFN